MFLRIFFQKKKKKFPVFAFLHFTLIETPPTFKPAELLQTNLDWIRYPRNVVTNLMKRINLKKVFGRKERRKMIGGKKGILLQIGEGKTIMVFFTSFRPNSKKKRERSISNFDIRSGSAAFNLFFF